MISLLIAITALTQAPDYIELLQTQVENTRTLAWKPYWTARSLSYALSTGDIIELRKLLDTLETQTTTVKDSAIWSAQMIRQLPEHVVKVERNALANCPSSGDREIADLKAQIVTLKRDLDIAEKSWEGWKLTAERAQTAAKALSIEKAVLATKLEEIWDEIDTIKVIGVGWFGTRQRVED